MAATRKQGGGDPAALPPESAAVAPEAPPSLPLPYSELFKRQFGARFRFELGTDHTTIRVIGFFPDIGCQKTWTLMFGPAWADAAIATIRDWKASRLG